MIPATFTAGSPAARELCNHLWQSTLFAGIAALLALLLRRNPARTRYWLWVAASAKFLIPFSLLVSLGGHLPWHSHAVASRAVTYVAIDAMSQPFSEGIEFNAPVMIAAAPSATPRPAVALLPLTLTLVWLLGAVVMTIFWLVHWRRIGRAVRSARPLLEGREVDCLRRMERIAGVPRTIPLLKSSTSMEPGIFGIVRPVLLWPEGISRHLDDAHLESILAHEVCHVRRRDNLISAIPMLVEAIFWFHPLVWWMERQLVKERERACDEQVLLVCGRPKAYAEGILKVCEFCVESPLTCVAGITGADLKQRVIQIMSGSVARRLTLAKKLVLAATAVCAVAVPVLLGQAQAARRMMLAAVDAAPMPLRSAVHAMIAEEQTPSTGEIAEMQAGAAPVGAAGKITGQLGTDPCATSDGAKFDVISIRPSKASRGNWDSDASADGVSLSGTVKALIQEAFGLRDFQVTGGPDWVASDTFDIKAKFDVPEKGTDQAARKAIADRWRQRYRSLLSERFQFQCHMTTKELPVYDLVVAKGGHKLKPTAADGDGDSVDGHGDGHKTQVTATGVNSENIVAMLAGYVGRTVVDKTGLTGRYDFTLDWETEKQAEQSALDGEASTLPELPIAVEEQLGLKLVPSKGPVPVLVIDHIERPTMEGAEAAPVPVLTKQYSRYATFTNSFVSAVPAAQAETPPAPAPPPVSPPKYFDRTVGATLDGPAHDLGPVAGMISWAPPVYPPEAKAARIQGVVALKVTIANTGAVEDVQVISGPQELRQGTIDAVKQWKFDPSWDNGYSVGVKTIGVIYSLPNVVPIVGPVPPADEAAAGVKQYGGHISAPTIILRTDPAYTDLAKTDRVEGNVMISLVVDEHGLPQHVQVALGLGDGLDEKALDAVKQYRFKPAKENDTPVAVFMYLPVSFKLN